MRTRMREFVLKVEQEIERPLERVFAFFADAANLQRLTPGFLHFEILTPMPIEMRVGALIDYRIRLHGMAVKWRTEIAVWEPMRRFVDVQLRGPYRKWVHTHTFEATSRGTLVRDEVVYAVPGGGLVERLFVRPRLEEIFGYRKKAIVACLGGKDGGEFARERMASV